MSTASGNDAPGPGSTPVPRAAIIAFTVLIVGVALVALYSMWTFWPPSVRSTTGQDMVEQGVSEGPQQVSWFAWRISLDTEILFFLTVAIAGALGGLIHTVRSFSWYVGNRNMVWSWVPYNLLLPLVGALAGTVFYLVLRAGLFSPSTDVNQASPFGFAAIAILAGLFSPEAFEKLRLIAGDIFAKPATGADHVEPAKKEDTESGS